MSYHIVQEYVLDLLLIGPDRPFLQLQFMAGRSGDWLSLNPISFFLKRHYLDEDKNWNGRLVKERIHSALCGLCTSQIYPYIKQQENNMNWR